MQFFLPPPQSFPAVEVNLQIPPHKLLADDQRGQTTDKHRRKCVFLPAIRGRTQIFRYSDLRCKPMLHPCYNVACWGGGGGGGLSDKDVTEPWIKGAGLAQREPTRLQRGYRLSLSCSYQFACKNNNKIMKCRITEPGHECGVQAWWFLQDLRNIYIQASLKHNRRRITVAYEMIKVSQNSFLKSPPDAE